MLLTSAGAQAQTADFGDKNTFPSASSTANVNLRIGATVDTESAATTNTSATGDDTTGSDDEDGVTLPTSIVQGTTGSMTVNVTNTSGATAYLNAWIDWNNNGTLTDSGEQVATNTTIATGTSNSNRTISFTAPSVAAAGQVGVRVRLTSNSSPGPDGADGNGEVEDHQLTVIPPFALVVVNYNNNTIARFNGADGAALATWSPSGLSAPNYGYRLSDNTFLVANGSSNTITKYNPFTGAYLGTLVASGSGLNFPYQMAVSTDGSIYIANQNAANVLRFNQTTGAVLGTVLTTTNPAGLVFDTAGQIYVTQNTSAGSLRLYNSAGTFQSTIATWPANEYPRGLAWGPDGRLYVNVRDNTNSTGRVDVITFPARTRTTFVSMDAGSNPYTGIKWGPDGNLYVVDYGENQLQVYSPSGATVRTITANLNGPHAVAFTDISAATQDFGDYSRFASASSNWNSTLRLGNESDTETAARTSDTANGDDIDDIDDEDGVTLPDTLVAGSTGSVTIKRLNTSGATAYLNGWIDFNNDGVLTGTGEQVIVNQTVANGTNGVSQSYTFSVPATAVNGAVGARFRLSSTSNPGPTGSSGNGEVEDYLVTIVAATTDFGDYSAFPSASSNTNSNLRIGATVDSEVSASLDSTATGDDTSGSDDEDGVTLPASIVTGTTGSMTVNVSNTSGATAYLNAWIDFNGNGMLTDSGEQVATNTTVATGTSSSNRTVSFTVPAAATLGTAGVRVRLTSTSSPGPDGADGSGEVEDYTTTVVGNVAAGNLVWVDANDNGRFDTGEGVDGVTVQLLNTSNVVVGTDITDAAGLYHITTVAGTYYLKIPASEFASGEPLFGRVSLLGNGADNGRDDDWDENGIDDAAPATNGIRTPNFTLTAGSEPTTNETGQDSGWDNGVAPIPADANADLTQDFGFAICTQTNLLANGSFETANPSNLTFTNTFPSGGSAIAKTRTTQANTDIANWTFDSGSYVNDSTRATDGSRFVYLDRVGQCVGQQFTVGSVVSGFTQLTAGNTYTLMFDWVPFDASAPNTPPAGNNCQIYADFYYTNSTWSTSTLIGSFSDFQEPKTGDFLTNPRPYSTWNSLDWRRCRYKLVLPPPPAGQNYLTVFITAGGSSGKLLIDNVRLTQSCVQTTGMVGNLVFNDTNNNGLKDAAETGIDNVLMHLYRRPASGSPIWVGDAYTTSGGRYFFAGMAPGNYFVQVDPYNFAATTPSWWSGGAIAGPLYNKVSSAGNGNPNVAAGSAADDDASEKGVDDATPATNGIVSPDFALGAGTEPLSSGKETGAFNTLDDAADSYGDMTIDFGFRPPATLDFSDHSSFPSASSTANTKLRIGAAVDAEAAATTNSTATGDDTTGTDDEDGVTLPASIVTGTTGSMTVNVTNTSGATAYLNAWIDFNRNGTLTDIGEQVATNTAIATGTSNSNKTVSFTVPGTATAGAAGVRVRLTSVSSPGADGTDGTGEVEDHVLTIQENLTVGNLVWNDVNQNGVKDAAESGIDGVTVKLYQGSTLKGTTTTAGGGLYSFTAPPGSGYYVEITTPPAGYPYSSGPVDTADNGGDNDNNGDQSGRPGTAIYSQDFTLANNQEPGSSGSTNIENTIDIGLRAVPNPATLLEFTSESGSTPMNPAVKNTAITSTSQLLPATGSNGLTINQETASTYLPPMRTGTKFLNMTGTSTTYNTALEAARTSLTPVTKTLYTTITFAPGTTGTIGNVLADICPSTNNAFARFFLTWHDGTAYRTAWTNTVTTYHASWTSFDMPFVNGTAVPSGAALAGKTFLLEFVHWGSPGTWVDNLMLAGSCTVATTDFGDHSSFPSASSTVNANLRIGALTDVEATATTDATATGDDTTGADDEDGVTLPASLVTGTTGSMTVNVTNTSGATAYLNAWIDFNRNGVITDSGEQVAANVAIATATSNSNRSLSFNVPAAASPGTAGVRVRLTSVSSPGLDGADGNGEVEDHTVTIACPTVTVNPATLTTPTVGTAYSQTLTQTGGNGTITWSVSNGTLPVGLALGSTTGIITGTATSATATSFTIRASDVAGCVGTRTFNVTPVCPAMSVSPTSAANGTLGIAYTQTMTASGGKTPYSGWTVTSGTLPAGLALNASTGVISGTPTASNGA
ncbi:GEVED domain-containing protein, partial [Prosthecobacter sp.]|uniref:GEVED domain-containing protein n=1 Tax=Prosthecobacter sp. TaxID=1965333 RepID=UPI0025F7073E